LLVTARPDGTSNSAGMCKMYYEQVYLYSRRKILWWHLWACDNGHRRKKRRTSNN